MKRQVPKKNYIFLIILFVTTIGVVFLFSYWYKENEKYKKEDVLKPFLPQITVQELDSYIMENPDIIMYLMLEEESVDRKIKTLLVDENAKDELVIIDCLLATPDFKKYTTQKIVIPNLIAFKGGKVADIMYNKEKNIAYKDVNNFLIKNQVIISD